MRVRGYLAKLLFLSYETCVSCSLPRTAEHATKQAHKRKRIARSQERKIACKRKRIARSKERKIACAICTVSYPWLRPKSYIARDKQGDTHALSYRLSGGGA